MAFAVVVPVSGGKDSQACLKLAVEEYGPNKVLGLFCDPGFEHPFTYGHLNTMQRLYGVRIKHRRAGTVDEKVLKYGRFPGGGARHCTDELKIKPAKEVYKTLADIQGGFEVWYGMRFAESGERSRRYKEKVDTDLYPPHEIMRKYPKYLQKKGVMFRLPILMWTAEEVFDYLDGQHNPLYDAGFGRVGCFPCLAAGDRYKEQCFEHDETGQQHRERVRTLEEQIGKPVWTSKGGRERHADDYDDGPGCGICSI